MFHVYPYSAARWPLTPHHRHHRDRDRDSEPRATEPSYYYTCDKNKGILEVELPGVQKENIMVEVHGHHLEISGKRFKKDEGEEKEKLLASYQLELRLGHDADTENVKGVSCKDGVLVVHIPTIRRDEPRRIAIGS